jgi:hypothetical protein
MSLLHKGLSKSTLDRLANAPHPAAWFIANKMVTETGRPFEWVEHNFMLQPISDFSKTKILRKSAQCGASADYVILAGGYITEYLGLNIAHTLPDKNVVESFVMPKADVVIDNNVSLASRLVVDNKGLKGYMHAGNKKDVRFVYYRGAYSQKEAINFTVDMLIRDEIDRSDAKVMATYPSRMDASEHKLTWDLSNPTAIGYGIDLSYQESDQMHWFVKCNHCNWEWYFDWPDDNNQMDERCHFIDLKRAIRACGRCRKEISHKALCFGRWVAKKPDAPTRGYWISQLFYPWKSALELIQASKGDPEIFHNFNLGKAYTPQDLLVDRQAILRATSPGETMLRNITMGVDNGVQKHYVIGSPAGIIKYGVTTDEAVIERLMLQYNMSCVVIDANPYPAWVRKLVKKYPNRVFMNYYVQDRNALGTVRWGEGKEAGVVLSDRTKVFDIVAGEIARTEILFRLTGNQLEDYIKHWAVMYRTVVVNARGIKKGEWITQEGKPDHWAHATVYWRIATERAFGVGGQVVRAPAPNKATKTTHVNPETNEVDSDIDIDEALNNNQRKRNKGTPI